ncbi:HSP20-like chaperone [Curvularia clavata]|uniref:HSP20-like chaperone n=1 Tax=Curvularia clavata TaxID=95742 RepID=A0A9Q8Z4N8_CURCL|nr:HSP20-like chaperone [Curvularia clavata]
MLQLANLYQHSHPIASHGSHSRVPGHHVGLFHQAPLFFSDTLRDKHELCPNFDIRETATSYCLEGEFPGISGPEAIEIEWINQNRLRVTGHIEKTDLKAEWSANESPGTPPGQPANEQQGAPEPSVTSENKLPPKAEEPKEWLNERAIGTFVRTFDFPSAVHTDGILVKLYQGLLRINVPKKAVQAVEKKKIPIQCGEQVNAIRAHGA